MSEPARLSDIAERYEAILCDVWGVVRDGRALVPEALDALAKFRARGGRVLLLSNSPRRAGSLLNFLAQMGGFAPGEAPWDGAVTSGEATRAVLASLAPGPACKLGPDWDDPLYEGLGLDFAPLEHARFISATGLVDYESETVADYADLLREAQLRRLPMVCVNPDRLVQVGDRLLPCAGALAEAYEEMGGQVIYAGKPHPPIYTLAYDRLTEISGRVVDADAILAVGDGPETDVLGAQQEGLDCLFVASGILGAAFETGFDADSVDRALARSGVAARWSADRLVW
ncbi:TIGR01459 family HAD-type hydrolase [Marinicauda algicola]|uniref:TIGR01459 family HAD-type hydrolase n=1 Tax=Marinicauda algicola TaxID=2029849 RepID=A0A4S2H045_9PROT|nr:TIGR01459 family HAD-type hydrolase [Marinicauda algicola]TGY88452.1 TIGR01459 family HAD-type hydrolase [Marinicauda algicola]